MTDTPIPARIILTLGDNDSTGEEFISLSTTLYGQNLIYWEPRELRKRKNNLELSVIFYDTKSFKNWQKNSSVIEFYSKNFSKKLIGKPRTVKEKDVIIEIDKVENCNCEDSSFFILNGRSLKFCNELVCGSCLKQVPYSKIPLEIEIEEWQRHHERIYMNWLESGIFEKEAFKELTNYKKGKLNLAGENLRKQLTNHFKKPVYLEYFVYEPEYNMTCPICGEDGIESGLIKPNKICKTCNTIFGYDDK